MTIGDEVSPGMTISEEIGETLDPGGLWGGCSIWLLVVVMVVVVGFLRVWEFFFFFPPFFLPFFVEGMTLIRDEEDVLT